MRLQECNPGELSQRCRAGQLHIDYGAALVRVRSPLDAFARTLQRTYGAFRPPQSDQDAFADYHVEVVRPRGPRAFIRPQSQFRIDGIQPFDPFPCSNALPLFEWGVNWCFGQRANQYILLHAGVLAKGGRAVIMAAPPGSGKSTLAAAMMLRGFRLLSDEFGVLRPDTGDLVAMLKPVALKNQSVEIIRAFSEDAVIGPLFTGTRKGDVAHLAPNDISVDAIHQATRPALVIFPSFEAGATLNSRRLPGKDAFAHLAFNSFNYHLLGPIGFEAVADVIAACPAYQLRYSDLDAAISHIEGLLDQTTGKP
ncbi:MULTISPECIES: HprK-related kinase A [unclassified Ectothiorhodospira]|uniref:HprK-related kinase A n=1 Tax=unclassified Ectothiorhodospira TaxID=2684909 RepID=UPI001EE7C413|nr:MULTISPECIES: HprK-related kinase A [unclassified Ectothiorhodospira]MCG5517321.1 HprK-related kinase A [Ectothiorhodospira sp. 9100]MCG5520016.1 HprK-related kinase A [Ectothiorhodospira sp. 9905]